MACQCYWQAFLFCECHPMRLPTAAIALLSSALTIGAAQAADFVYTPLLPAFGGDPLYSSYFYQNAEIQNKHRQVQEELSQTEQFKQDLQRRLFSAVATEITEAIYGENATPDGTFEIEGLVIEFQTIGSEVVLTIQDLTSTTTIKLPKNS